MFIQKKNDTLGWFKSVILDTQSVILCCFFAPLSCTIVVPRWQRSKSLVVTSWRSLSTGNLATWLTRVRRDVCILRLCSRLAFPSQWLLLRSSAQMHAPMQSCPQAGRRMSTLKIDYMEMILPGICSIVHIYTKVLKSMQCNSICLVFEVLIKCQKKSKEGTWQRNWRDSQSIFFRIYCPEIWILAQLDPSLPVHLQCRQIVQIVTVCPTE